MSAPTITVDPTTATLTLTTRFAAPLGRVWDVVADPRKLERWWGPPTYPATVVDHDLRPGGLVTYFMTSPEGEKYSGWWRVLEVNPPSRLLVEDGFGEDPDHAPADLPISTMTLTLSDESGGTTVMTLLSQFASAEALQQALDMGMQEGIAGSVGQIPDILAEADPA